MKNHDVEKALVDCYNELREIRVMIRKNPTAQASSYLSRYAVIKSCGTIERLVKTLLLDACVTSTTHSWLSTYLEKNLLKKPLNIELDNIYKFLNQFDRILAKKIKAESHIVSKKTQITFSLKSLADVRNSFAHGGSSTMGIDDVYRHFLKGQLIIRSIDKHI